MEKILLALDTENVDIPAVEFACYVAALSRSKLTGVFVEHAPVAVAAAGYPNEAVQLLDTLCSNRSVRPEVLYLKSKQAAKELITESRFADLIILGADPFEKAFLAEVLADAECPVLIAPPTFDGIDEIIFTYDGSKSAVFAIKQFTYLFPPLAEKRAMLLEVTGAPTGELTQKDRIKELLKAHYSGIGYHMLHGKATDELLAYLIPKKNSMVVMGAYGKNLLSKMLKQTRASQLVKTIDCPFFITHC